jgi:glutathione S-transferase
MLNAHLGEHKYLVGDALTIADFAVAAPLFYAQQAELSLEPHARIRAWFADVSSLPCWSETAPQLAAAA